MWIGERACASHADFGTSPKCSSYKESRFTQFKKARDGEGAIASVRGARAPQLYVLFSIGAPTLLPHSVHEPS